MFLLLLFLCFLMIIAFKRYVPVSGIRELENFSGNVFLVDLRNYQTSTKAPVEGAYNIPYAYLKRYYQEIPKKNVVIITSDIVEKNLAARFLRKKKFNIIGYMVLNEKEGIGIWNNIQNQKVV